MSPGAWLAALPPVAAAFLLLRATRWDRHGAPTPRALVAALALGLGLGMGSVVFFLSLVAVDGTRSGVLAGDLTLLLAAAVCRWRSSSSSGVPATLSPPEPAAAPLTRDVILAAAATAAALAGSVAFAVNTLAAPHGEWDAWAIWNLRARWLFRAGPAWPTAFSEQTIHGDYPLLVPGAVARLWVYGAADPTAVPIVVAAVYALALVLLLYGALSALRGRTAGLLGALCLLGTPLFITSAAWQYADIPLAFYLLAALALLAVHDHDPGGGPSALAWAGAATGLAAWTKNEGLLFVLCLAAVRGGLALARRRWAPASAAWFLAGLAPPAAVVLFFKLALAPPTYEFAHQRAGDVLGRLADPARYAAIARAASLTLVNTGGPILVALTVYAILLGRTRDHRARAAARAAALVLALVAFGYGAVYLVTPADLVWQLGHSLDRLILQLWPSLLFAFFLFTAGPAELDGRRLPRSRAPSAPARTARRRSRRPAGATL